MKKLSHRIAEGVRGVLCPPPSFFDFAVGGFLGIFLFSNETHRQMFFVYYIIFLVVLTLGMKAKRAYKSFPLLCLSLWSLGLVFKHSFEMCEGSFVRNYFNIYLMSEYFIYIFFGCLFVSSVIRYSTNPVFIIILLPVAMIPWFQEARFTLYFSILASSFIYLLLKKRYLVCSIIAIATGVFIKIQFFWVWQKWFGRPLVWHQLLIENMKHPVIGSGFNKYLTNIENMIWVKQGGAPYGWTLRHNDYLSLGAYIGPIVIVFIVCFIIQSLRQVRVTPYLVLFLIPVLSSFFQMTCVYPEKAAASLLMIAVSLTKTYNKGEV